MLGWLTTCLGAVVVVVVAPTGAGTGGVVVGGAVAEVVVDGAVVGGGGRPGGGRGGRRPRRNGRRRGRARHGDHSEERRGGDGGGRRQGNLPSIGEPEPHRHLSQSSRRAADCTHECVQMLGTEDHGSPDHGWDTPEPPRSGVPAASPERTDRPRPADHSASGSGSRAVRRPTTSAVSSGRGRTRCLSLTSSKALRSTSWSTSPCGGGSSSTSRRSASSSANSSYQRWLVAYESRRTASATATDSSSG